MSQKNHAAFRRLLHEIGTVDAVGVEERVAKFTTRSIKKKSKLFGLNLAISMVDLTTLEGTHTAYAPHSGHSVFRISGWWKPMTKAERLKRSLATTAT